MPVVTLGDRFGLETGPDAGASRARDIRKSIDCQLFMAALDQVRSTLSEHQRKPQSGERCAPHTS